MFLYGLGYAILDHFIEVTAMPPGVTVGGAVHLSAEATDALLASLPAPADRVPGGSVFNTLKTAAALGNRCLFSGSCGTSQDTSGHRVRDEAGVFFQRAASRAGVEGALRSQEGSTGRFLLLKGTERRVADRPRGRGNAAIVASPAAAATVVLDQFDEDIAASSDCVVLEGMLFFNPGLAARVVDFCVDHEKPLAVCAATVDASVAVGHFLADRRREAKPRLPRLFLCANEREWAQLREAGVEPGFVSDLVCLETKGSRGGILWERTAERRWEAEKPAGEVVDESGAGDVFAGAFLAQYLLERPVDSVLAFAAKLAADVCAVPLCRPATTYRLG
jgi:sugar/nucleoside kinase (ribokinase family)